MLDTARFAELPRITPSALADTECGYRWDTLRNKKLWPSRPRAESVSHGIATHETLKLAYQNRVGDRPCVDHLEAWARTAVFKGRWPEGVDKRDATQRVISSVCAIIGNDESDPEAVAGILDLELPLEGPIWHESEVIGLFSCRLDQTLVRASEPDRLCVREIKTTIGEDPPGIDLRKVYIQLALAKREYKDLGFKRFCVEFLFVADGRVTMERVEDRDLKGIHAVLMNAAVKTLTDKKHQPNPGEGCVFCPLKNTCPARKMEG